MELYFRNFVHKHQCMQIISMTFRCLINKQLLLSKVLKDAVPTPCWTCLNQFPEDGGFTWVRVCAHACLILAYDLFVFHLYLTPDFLHS
jgi:hypothetical protein